MPFDALRSLLFVPATNPERVAKARGSEADAVIADLEDAVPDAEKNRARESLVAELRDAAPAGCAQLVRINALDTPHAAADLRALARVPLDGLVVPKAEPAELARLPGGLPPVIAIVETAAGVREAFDTARLEAVAALMIGTVDLATELGAAPDDDEHALLFACSSLAIDSVAAGLGGPIDGVCTAIRDEQALRRQALRAKALGYRAKACIHPAQLAAVNEIFSPSDEEVAAARRVVAAYDEAAAGGRGAVSVDGEMVDAPVVERARRLLSRAPAERT